MNANTGNNLNWKPPKRFSNYEIIEKIDDGGMGSIYKAVHIPTQETVAIKIMIHDSQYKRFEREAEAIQRLSHPNFVRYHAQGEISGRIYIVMDLVDGAQLKTFLDENILTIQQKLTLFHKILNAIYFAHTNGVIHRDIKPDNILITPEHEPIILDFGLSKCIELVEKKDETYLTLEGQILGTPGYMSPEQAKGETNKQDQRTDIFSLGIIFYEMLCDHNPFEGENLIEICYKIGNTPPTPIQQYLTSIPEELINILNNALANNIDERYQKVKDFLDDLNHFLARIQTREKFKTGIKPRTGINKAEKKHETDIKLKSDIKFETEITLEVEKPEVVVPESKEKLETKIICLLCGAENKDEAIYCAECNQVLKHQFRRNTTKIKRDGLPLSPKTKPQIPISQEKIDLMKIISQPSTKVEKKLRASYPTHFDSSVPAFAEISSPKIAKKRISVFDILIGSLGFLFALLPIFHIYHFSIGLHLFDLCLAMIASALLFKYRTDYIKYIIFPCTFIIYCCTKHYLGIITTPFDINFLPKLLSGFVLVFFLSQCLINVYEV